MLAPLLLHYRLTNEKAHTMHCPFCNAEDTKVIDSRLVAEGNQVRRRRECRMP
jgi:hypothetical protein